MTSAGAGAGLALLGGCAGSGPSDTGARRATRSGGVVELTFWSWVPNIDRAVDLFNETHDDIQVNFSAIPAGADGGYGRMYSSINAGTAPDLAQVEYQELPSFLAVQGLENITSHAQRHRDKFVGWQWDQGVFQDDVFAIPQASGPMALFYREDLFGEWGIEVPGTWEEFADAAEAVREADPGARICTFPPGNSAWFTSMAWQSGASWFGYSGERWTVNMDGERTRRAASYWQDMVERGLVDTIEDTSNAFWAAVQEGNLVAYAAASWNDALIRGNAPDTAGAWHVTDIPQWEAEGEFRSSNWGGSSTAVMRGCAFPEEATEFAVWLNSNPESIDLLITGGYGWPSVEDLSDVQKIQNDPEVFKFYDGQNINEVFAKADANVDRSWGWTPATSRTYNSLADGLTDAVNGTDTFLDAVQYAQQSTVTELQIKGWEVDVGRA